MRRQTLTGLGKLAFTKCDIDRSPDNHCPARPDPDIGHLPKQAASIAAANAKKLALMVSG